MYNRILIGLCLGLGLVTSTYAQMTAQAASTKLSAQAKEKINKGGIDLDALLNNASNDLIIEYDVESAPSRVPQKIIEHLKQKKQKLRSGYKKENGVELLREYNALPVSFFRVTNRNTLVQLLNDPNVKAVYPNRISKETTDESYALIGQKVAAEKGFKGDGTAVAVLDTGTNYRHADFGNCTAPNTPATCRVSHSIEIAPEDNSLDENGHGSNVAGIVSKVAPNTKIVSMDVFRGDLVYDSDTMAAINWVINNAKTTNIKSVNMSLGDRNKYTSTCTNSPLTNSFAELKNVGVIPVVAAGNEGFLDGVAHPACAPDAVSVGAVHDSNVGNLIFEHCTDTSNYADKVACFSNSSSNLTILAPGIMMNAGGVTQNGTSQATPHVAGAIAVLRSDNAFPNDSVDETIERLKTSGNIVTDQRNSLRFPRLNLDAALNGAGS